MTGVDLGSPRSSGAASSAALSPDLVAHAIAQLPDHVTAVVEGAEDEIRRARVVAEAYGVAERITFTERRPGSSRQVASGFVVDGGTRLPESRRFAALLHEIGGTEPTSPSRGDDLVLGAARVAILTNQPTHYRVPLFNGLASRLEAAGASMQVLFARATPGDRPWLRGDASIAFDHEYLRSLVLPVRRHRPPSIPRGLGAELERFHPTIVLTAGFSPFVTGRVLRVARRLGARVGIWSGDVPFTSSGRSTARRALRRRLLAKADFAIAYGWQSREYLRRLAPSLPVAIGRNASPIPGRAPHRVREAPIVMAVADLSLPGKGIELALDAFSLVPDVRCSFEIIGGGHEHEEIRRRVRGDARVALLGPLDPTETRKRLSGADIYIFPSRVDIFGLSLLEAMGAGLASVVSPRPGAVEDLCVPDVNCVMVDGGGPGDWARAIRRLVEDADERTTLGSTAAATVAARWTMDHAVDAMVAGLRLGAIAPR